MTAFVTDNGKWIFYLLPFGINIGPSVFSYVLGRVLAQHTEFTLNYLNNIMILFETWQEHLKHPKAVLRCLQDADLKIKHSKCKFFKSKVHYIGFLVGTNGVQPLPGKVVPIKVLEPPKDIDE